MNLMTKLCDNRNDTLFIIGIAILIILLTKYDVLINLTICIYGTKDGK